MKVEVPKGRYVVAVSGGVDSIALLDLLIKSYNPLNLQPSNLTFVVAHFNHGIREDSSHDEKVVAKAARKYQLTLEVGRAKLRSNASEDQARAARYEFLYKVKEKYSARAIVTAHHQDDLIETAILNLLRGSGRRGLTALAQNPEVMRPLLNISKSDLIKYAKAHNLKWREDVTNQDIRYLRNYVRIKIMPKMSPRQRQIFLTNINRLNQLNPLLDQEIATLSQTLLENGQIKRQQFINLPPEISNEIIAGILRQNGMRSFDKKLLDRLSIAIKTARPGTKHDVAHGTNLNISRNFAHLNADSR